MTVGTRTRIFVYREIREVCGKVAIRRRGGRFDTDKGIARNRCVKG